MTDSQTNTDGQPDDRPQYGQYHQPEYGAMANQYPAGYNPYVYGAPDPQAAAQPQGQPQQPAPAGQAGTQSQPVGQWPGTPYPRQPAARPQGAWNAPQQPVPPHTPRIINGIDVDDPNQNPLYGHWDPLSIVSLVCALLLPVPVLPAIMGAISMRRTRAYHMKGFWLGFVAVFVNVFYTIMVAWLALNGMTVFDYYQQMLGMLSGDSGVNAPGTISA